MNSCMTEQVLYIPHAHNTNPIRYIQTRDCATQDYITITLQLIHHCYWRNSSRISVDNFRLVTIGCMLYVPGEGSEVSAVSRVPANRGVRGSYRGRNWGRSRCPRSGLRLGVRDSHVRGAGLEAIKVDYRAPSPRQCVLHTINCVRQLAHHSERARPRAMYFLGLAPWHCRTVQPYQVSRFVRIAMNSLVVDIFLSLSHPPIRVLQMRTQIGDILRYRRRLGGRVAIHYVSWHTHLTSEHQEKRGFASRWVSARIIRQTQSPELAFPVEGSLASSCGQHIEECTVKSLDQAVRLGMVGGRSGLDHSQESADFDNYV